LTPFAALNSVIFTLGLHGAGRLHPGGVARLAAAEAKGEALRQVKPGRLGES
jgi:hypothetical protein